MRKNTRNFAKVHINKKQNHRNYLAHRLHVLSAPRTPGQIHKGRCGSFVPLWRIAVPVYQEIYLQQRYLDGRQLGDVIAAVKRHDART